MSDRKISPDFLGEQMLRMQTDLRGVRTDQERLEKELRADIRHLDVKVDGLGAKVDRHDASNQARFEQLQRTIVTNFEVVLKALDNSRR